MDNLTYLIRELMAGQPQFNSMVVPEDTAAKQNLLRHLMNVRMPMPISEKFLEVQDAELGRQLELKGIVHADEIQSSGLHPRIKLWQGDITRLDTDAIVNAANRQMLGCFVPLHRCIDNAIHSSAGVQLRLECQSIMQKQGHDEPTGSAKITLGYNLPAKHVIHTVGPIVGNDLTLKHEEQLAACYSSCLNVAEENHLKSIAFCCISTGEFRFPNQRAAEIAVKTVSDYFINKPYSSIDFVMFNVFKDVDFSIYKKLLQEA